MTKQKSKLIEYYKKWGKDRSIFMPMPKDAICFINPKRQAKKAAKLASKDKGVKQ